MGTIITHGTCDFAPIAQAATEGETFDRRKSESVIVSHFYHNAFDILLKKYGSKIFDCANILEFSKEPDENGEIRFVFKQAWFCKVRFCPMCQWRRQKAWQGRFLKAKPLIEAAYPNHKWLLLTLTVQNCQNGILRETLNQLNKAFRKLTLRKDWPAVGWVKAIEVTREQKRLGYSHPHIHSVLLVPTGYFSGHSYISQASWANNWQKALQVDYTPMVDVRRVKDKPEKGRTAYDVAIVEVLKYAVKPDDLTAEQTWLHEITPQLKQSRWVSVGGVLRQFLQDDEPEPDDANSDEFKGGYFARYNGDKGRYNIGLNGEL